VWYEKRQGQQCVGYAPALICGVDWDGHQYEVLVEGRTVFTPPERVVEDPPEHLRIVPAVQPVIKTEPGVAAVASGTTGSAAANNADIASASPSSKPATARGRRGPAAGVADVAPAAGSTALQGTSVQPPRFQCINHTEIFDGFDRLDAPAALGTAAWLDETCIIVINDMLMRDNMERVKGDPLHPKCYILSPRFLNRLLQW
jgi:hypothetical protein